MDANLCVFLCVDKKRAKQIGCHFADWSQLAHTLMESRTIIYCSGGRIVSWIIYCWLVWCERKTLLPAGNLRSFMSKRTGC